MIKPERMSIRLNVSNLSDDDAAHRQTKETILAQKIARTLQRHIEEGWQVENITYDENGAQIIFLRTEST
jgi:hypothetical protein